VNCGRYQDLTIHAIEVMQMIEPPRFTGDADAVRDRGSPPRMPRWVKWPAIVIGLLLLLVLVVLPLFGVRHGPGQHMPGGGTAPASVVPATSVPAGGGG
jgi:hypothetical protein